MSNTTKIILNVLVFFISYVFFVLMLFPFETVLGHFLSQPNRYVRSREPIEIQASHVDASLLFDSELRDFKLMEGDRTLFEAPVLEFGTSFLSLVTGRLNLDFHASYQRMGEIFGDFSVSQSAQDFEVEYANLSLSKLTVLNEALEALPVPIHLRGILSGTVAGSLTQDVNSREAEVDLKLFQALVRPTQYKVALPGSQEALEIPIPLMRFSSRRDPILIQAVLDGTQIQIKDLKIPGPDVSLSLKGVIRLTPQNTIRDMDLSGTLGFSERLKSNVEYLSFLDPDKEGGTYTVLIKGHPGRPQIKLGKTDLGQFIR